MLSVGAATMLDVLELAKKMLCDVRCCPHVVQIHQTVPKLRQPIFVSPCCSVAHANVDVFGELPIDSNPRISVTRSECRILSVACDIITLAQNSSDASRVKALKVVSEHQPR